VTATVVLGLCAWTHDSSAALLVDGALVGLVEEERLSGVKHTKAFPQRAVDWLLGRAYLAPGDVTGVAYNFALAGFVAAAVRPPSLRDLRQGPQRVLPRARGLLTVAAATRSRLALLARQFPAARVAPVRHHLTHALYAHLASGWSDSAVLVVDSLGERQTTTITDADRGTLRRVATVHDPHSLGYVYGAITEQLGYRRGDAEGTVMALAALGDPARFRSLFADAVALTRDGFAVHPRWFPLRVLDRRHPRVTPAWLAATGGARQPGCPIEQVHADLAAALQDRTEQVLMHLARRAAALTGRRRLCLAGGVAMNCVAVGRVLADGAVDEVFVPPAPGDAGTAIGAAAALSERIGRPVTPGGAAVGGGIGGCYLGPAVAAADVPAAAAAAGLACRRVADVAACLAEQLAAGRIVGLVQGRVEAGPRALGNRSILASPLTPGVTDRLNRTVKFREPFRPFAPVVLAEHAPEWFVIAQPSPFMSIAVPATARARTRIPEVVHTNGLARVQTVTADRNPLLAATLHRFTAITGVPVLINTSLNLKGAPIAGTVEAALDTLRRSGLDALIIEGWQVTR